MPHRSPPTAAVGRTLSSAISAVVLAHRLGAGGFQLAEEKADLIEAVEDQRDGGRGDGQLAVAEFAEDVFPRMRDGSQASAVRGTAGTLDRVHQTEDVAEDGGIVRVAFEA